MLPKRLANERSNSEVRNVVVIHHVEMDDLRAGFDYGIDLLPQPCKVGRENGGSYPGCLHEISLRVAALGERACRIAAEAHASESVQVRPQRERVRYRGVPTP